MKFFVVCPRGLEGPLHDELNRIISEALNSQYAPLKETMRSAIVGKSTMKKKTKQMNKKIARVVMRQNKK